MYPLVPGWAKSSGNIDGWETGSFMEFPGCCRLAFEARNQKKEAKELAVLEAMKKMEAEEHEKGLQSSDD